MKDKDLTWDSVNFEKREKRLFERYCWLISCCENCNKRVRFWCKVKDRLIQHQEKIITKSLDTRAGQSAGMTYKQFLAWCNDRACDGCWSSEVTICCVDIASRIYRQPFWKRKKEWLKIKDEIDIERVVNEVNEKIKNTCK